MKNEFIETSNTKKMDDICSELISPEGLIGPSLAMVTGPAGRGKTEAARHYAVRTEAVYLPPLNVRSPVMLLREIAFELGKIRPYRMDGCLTVIADETMKSRRLIIVDEADLLAMSILEMLRNINERFSCPILLIGEDELKGKIASRRRLVSRIRRRMEFSPINQADIAYFFQRALEQKIGPDLAATIQRRSNGDWRPVLTLAIGIERAMRASGKDEVTAEMIKNVPS